MNWIRNVGLVLLSLFASFVASEGILRIDGRYMDQANSGVAEKNSNKIWTRGKNTSSLTKHPDLGSEVDVRFDEFGSRESYYRGKDIDIEVGVFGDSFVENRRILSEFTVTEVLNSLSETTHFWNFGVDGYGLEQSFQHWLDKSKLVDMGVVLYVFCVNDLTDTYQIQLFEREEMSKGKVINTANTDVPAWIQIASKVHLTYLFIESYYRFKSLRVSKSEFVTRLREKFTKSRIETDERRNDSYASDLTTQFLHSESTVDNIEEASHFVATLKMWDQLVKEKNGRFIVVVLPREEEKLVSSKLIPRELEIIQLKGNDHFKYTKNKSWHFKRDGHWNEYGNLSAAISLSTGLKEISPLDASRNQTWANHLQAIDDIYDLYQSSSPKN